MMSNSFRVALRAIGLCAMVIAVWVGVPASADASPPVQRLVRGLQAPWGVDCHAGRLTLRISKPGVLEEFNAEVDCRGERTVVVVTSGKYRGASLVREGQKVWQSTPGSPHMHPVSHDGLHRSWVGTDFTPADVLGLDAFYRDYEAVATFSGEHEGVEVTALTLRGTGVHATWGKVEALVRAADGTPQQMRFYDHDGVLARRQILSPAAPSAGSDGTGLLRRMVPEDSASEGFSELLWQANQPPSSPPLPHLATNAHRRRP